MGPINKKIKALCCFDLNNSDCIYQLTTGEVRIVTFKNEEQFQLLLSQRPALFIEAAPDEQERKPLTVISAKPLPSEILEHINNFNEEDDDLIEIQRHGEVQTL